LKATVCARYGPPEVLELVELATPAPKDNEILVRIHAVAVTTEDPLNRRGEPFALRMSTGLLRPKNPILGAEFSGEIEAIGKDVKLFKQGDQVLGTSGTAFGCYADYVCVPEDGVLAIKWRLSALKKLRLSAEHWRLGTSWSTRPGSKKGKA
jgi:NADPH:quinone reductase-like Zn-dependent oxidoreductase